MNGPHNAMSETTHSFSILRFEAVGFDRCLIVLTSGNAIPVVSTLKSYGVWRATCSAGPRLFPIFFGHLHQTTTSYWAAQEMRGKE